MDVPVNNSFKFLHRRGRILIRYGSDCLENAVAQIVNYNNIFNIN